MSARRGQVISRSSRHVVVRLDGRELRCELRGRLRRWSGSLVVGDEVRVSTTAAGGGTIEEVLPRSNQISRRVASGGGRELVLAANVGGLLAVFAARRPRLKPGALLRLLVAAETQGLDAAVVVNKVDLGVPADVRAALAGYPALGYPVLWVSAATGAGWAELTAMIGGRALLLAGPSGAGKSSLASRLTGRKIRIAEVSSSTEKGRHTTTRAAWYPVPGGGAIIDSPGFRNFALWGVEPAALVQAMPDLAAAAARCRFGDCRHRAEPDCAVRRAAGEGVIPRHRYRGYLQILAELDGGHTPS